MQNYEKRDFDYQWQVFLRLRDEDKHESACKVNEEEERMDQLIEKVNSCFTKPLIAQEPTQSPKTTDSEDPPNHGIPQISQIHFSSSQYHTKFLEKDYQRIKE